MHPSLDVKARPKDEGREHRDSPKAGLRCYFFRARRDFSLLILVFPAAVI